MQALGIHFLVVQNNETNPFTRSQIPVAIISVGNQRTLYIYDLWKNHTHSLILQAGQVRDDFYEKFGIWSNVRPVVAIYQNGDGS
jgi:hypothetical protein